MKQSTKPISSFAWIPTTTSASSHRLIYINKDGVIDIMKREESLKLSWDPRGSMMVTNAHCINMFDVEKRTNIAFSEEEDIESEEDIVEKPPRLFHQSRGPPLLNVIQENGTFDTQATLSDARPWNPTSLLNRHDVEIGSGNTTPRPGDITAKDVGMLRKKLHVMALKQEQHILHEERAHEMIDRDSIIPPLDLIRSDISVLMRERAQQGYSMDVMFSWTA